MIGQKIARLQVLKRIGNDKYGNIIYACICECGNPTTAIASALRAGTKKSCGCLRKEQARANGKTTTTHGMYGSKVYEAWAAIKKRCNNPNNKYYHRYGGRGIGIYKEWNDSFSSFYDYIGDAPSRWHTIDRIDNDGNYEPGNVRWVTAQQQCNNRSSNRLLEYKGSTRTLSDWSRVSGIHKNTLRNRLERGWTVEAAIENKTTQKRWRKRESIK